MADEQDDKQPSLELPGIFGRRRRQAPSVEAEPVPAEPVSEPVPEPTVPVATEVAHIPDPPDDGPPATTRRTRFRRGGAPAEVSAAREVAAADHPQVREPVPVGAPPLFAEEAGHAPASPAGPVEEGSRSPARSRPSLPSLPLPSLGGYGAATIAGLVVGLLLVGLTVGALRGCEEVRGTATCGGGIGFLLLVLIMAVLIALGGLILKAFGIPDPTSTSFLAVGMVAVVSLLFLIDVLLSGWMLLVLPVLTVGMYLAAQWVTTAFVDAD